MLRLNGTTNYSVPGNGLVTFGPFPDGASYSVVVQTQPSALSQTCVVSPNGTGTIPSSDVGVTLFCNVNNYTVSATVTNLTGTGLALRMNGVSTPVGTNGVVTLTNPIASGSNYNVEIGDRPTGQICVVGNGTGSVTNANITNVTVNCTTATYTIGGLVTGLTGSVVLQNNGPVQTTVSANGPFTLTGVFVSPNPYNVIVATQPAGQSCTVARGTGTLLNADVTDIGVFCTDNVPDAPTLTLTRNVKRNSLSWTRPARAGYYNLYRTHDTDDDYQLVTTSLMVDNYADDIAVHLENWAHLRYRVEACNSAGCTSSAPVVASSSIPSIGYLKASNTSEETWFGLYTAVSGDGNTIVIASPRESSGTDGINGPQDNQNAPQSGAVYVFVRDPATSNWSQQAYIKAANSFTGLGFGMTGLTLSHDGSTLAVSAEAYPSPGPEAGAVYVFARNGTSWTEQALLQPSNIRLSAQFGYSLGLSADGNSLFVGSPGEASFATGVGPPQTDMNGSNSGAAYLFTRSGGTWTESGYFKMSTNQTSASFGTSVAISADASTLAVGAPNEHSDGTGINGTEGNYNNQGSGAVYVFVRSGNTWVQQAYVKSPTPMLQTQGDHLGTALALSGNGNTLVVTATGEDSDARDVGGDQVNNDATDSGAAYVYTRVGGFWGYQAFLKASNTDALDEFGFAIDISDDGNTVAVSTRLEDGGARGVGGDPFNNDVFTTGAVYLFRRTGNTWAPGNYVHSSNSDLGDLFGTSIGLSADGETLVVGAYGEASNATGFNGDQDDNSSDASGAAYIF